MTDLRGAELLPVQRSHARFPQLDGYRAVAASAILATHVGFRSGDAIDGPWAGFLARLDFGVAIFFLLSGFLLYRPYAAAHLRRDARPRTGPYLWHRGLRILPAYWVVVVVAMLALPDNRGASPGVWLGQLLLLQTFSPHGLVPGLSQVWSLGTEVSFYLCLPLLGIVVHRLGGATPRARLRRQLVVLGVLAGVSLAYRVAVFAADAPPHWLYWLPAYLDWFAIGMALAAVSAYLDEVPDATGGLPAALTAIARAPGSCWLIGGAVFAVSTTVLAGPLDLSSPTGAASVVKHLLYALAAAWIFLPGVLGPQHEGAVRRFLASVPLAWLGMVSYGIFLWNLVMLALAAYVLGTPLFQGHFLQLLVATFALTTAVAAISWYVVEQPALRLRRLVR
jgi:peptidoglycan/LPS O-acetylase OafA/YrhL